MGHMVWCMRGVVCTRGAYMVSCIDAWCARMVGLQDIVHAWWCVHACVVPRHGAVPSLVDDGGGDDREEREGDVVRRDHLRGGYGDDLMYGLGSGLWGYGW